MNKFVKKILAASCGIAVMASSLAACGNETDTDKVNSTTDNSSTLEDVKTYNVDDTGAVEFNFDGTGNEIVNNTEE